MRKEKPGHPSGQLSRFLQGVLKEEFMDGGGLLLVLFDLPVAVSCGWQ